MIVFRYSINDADRDIETVKAAYDDFCKKNGLSSDEVAAIPDNITLEEMDREELIQVRNFIDKLIDKSFYEKKCQWLSHWTPKNGKHKPCKDKNMDCIGCEYYYSDDDLRW